MATILVIDDYEADRALLKLYAEKAGHKVIEMESAIDVLESIKSQQPDLVFLDIVMPEKEGIETIVEIKGLYPELPVVVMSGMDPQYMKLARDLGASECLPKHLIATKTAAMIQKYYNAETS